VVAAVSRHAADAVLLRTGDGRVDAHGAGDRSERTAPGEGGGRPVLVHELRHRVDDDAAGSGVRAVRGKPDEPVGVNTSSIRLDQTGRNSSRCLRTRADARDDRLRVRTERVLRVAGRPSIDNHGEILTEIDSILGACCEPWAEAASR